MRVDGCDLLYSHQTQEPHIAALLESVAVPPLQHLGEDSGEDAGFLARLLGNEEQAAFALAAVKQGKPYE